MSDATTKLLLPYILAAQAQKHVTHNEALRLLDGLVQLSILDRDLTAPPGSPADGDRYIVASGGTGDWAGWDLNVALWTDGAWLRLPPRTGWRAWVEDEGLLLVYDGAAWISTTPDALQNMALLGLGTTADAANPFSAKLNAALWTAKTVAEGGTGDLFYTMNKEAAGDDLGMTLQSGFVTKALVGLFGSERFRLAVSADGSTFFDGLIVDNATGIVEQPQLPRFKAYTNYDNYVGVGAWTKIGLNNTDYNDQGAFDAGTSLFTAPVDGAYRHRLAGGHGGAVGLRHQGARDWRRHRPELRRCLPVGRECGGHVREDRQAGLPRSGHLAVGRSRQAGGAAVHPRADRQRAFRRAWGCGRDLREHLACRRHGWSDWTLADGPGDGLRGRAPDACWRHGWAPSRRGARNPAARRAGVVAP